MKAKFPTIYADMRVDDYVSVLVDEDAVDHILRSLPIEMLDAEIKRRIDEQDKKALSPDDWMMRADAIKSKAPLMIMPGAKP